MYHNLNTDLDLTAVFNLKKSPACNPDLSQLNTFGNIKILKS